ncbi:MAG: hypothetical protein HYY84_00630 [Deltaproteobacteria bacterium]|nr:hypothetical protein [Deltaproteobacteria bacterium]
MRAHRRNLKIIAGLAAAFLLACGGASGDKCAFEITGLDAEYTLLIGARFELNVAVENACGGAASLRLDGEKPRGATVTADTSNISAPKLQLVLTPDIAHVGDINVAFAATNGREAVQKSTVLHVVTVLSRPQDAGTTPTPPPLGPLDPAGDADGDGISNGDELTTYHTNPRSRDTDHDGTPDGDEKGDKDGDGLVDALENRTADANANGNLDETDSAAGPQVSWARFRPAAVWNAQGTTRVEMMVVGGAGITRVALVNPYTRGEIMVDGQLVNEIEMYDDGTHGDLVAGDFTYTRGGIGANGRLPYLNAKVGRMSFRTLKVTHGAGNATIDLTDIFSSTPMLDLITVDPAARSTVTNVDPAGTVRIGERAVNVVDAALVRTYALEDDSSARRALQRVATQDVAKRYYQYFKDDVDWFYLISDEAFGMVGAYGVHINVRNAADGVGQQKFDMSRGYGSTSVLQGISWINYSTNGAYLHETMHQWGVHLDPSFGFSRDSHWGNADVDGHIGGFSSEGFVDHGDGTYTYKWGQTGGDRGPYGKIELYLMGLIPKADVPPIRVLMSPVTRISSTNDGATVRAAALKTWTIDDIIAKHGERAPGPATSQKAFRAAFVVVSDEPADDAFMTYLDLRAALTGAAQGDSLTWSFAQATGGRATLDTKPNLK